MRERSRVGRRMARQSVCPLMETLEGRVLLSGNMPAKLPEPFAVSAAPIAATSYHRIRGKLRATTVTTKTPTTQPTGTNSTPITTTTTATSTQSTASATSTLPGDANGDGVVDSFDLNVISSNWMKTNATWAMGDFNGDGIVDSFDLNLMSNNWLQTVAPPPPVTPPPPPTVSYDWHTQTINGVLNVWAPNPSDFGSTWTVNNASELFGPDGIPNLEGVHQGPIGDCYFLAAIGGTAKDRPAAIMNEVQNDANGGWQVTFQWRNASGVVVPVTIHTDNELSVGLQSETNGEVWPLVMEKAYAALRTFNGATSTNTMASIAWGYAGDAMRFIGQAFSAVYTSGQPDSWVYNQIATARAGNRAVLFHTSATATTMVASHVYVITGISQDANGQMNVTTYNPWGFYETRTLSDMMSNSAGQLVVANA